MYIQEINCVTQTSAATTTVFSCPAVTKFLVDFVEIMQLMPWRKRSQYKPELTQTKIPSVTKLYEKARGLIKVRITTKRYAF